MNRSISASVFPSPWKFGQIKPIPKKGSLLDPKNWRPIVINTSLSKILEHVLNKQLQNHLEENDIMSPVQHAYRKNRSCQSAWLEIDTLVARARNEGRSAALMCTDQSAAFNLVKADIIVAKLRVFGLDEASLHLIRSYLTGRSTTCTVGSATSPVTHLQSGVGEGSVVGPLFFVATLCDVSVVSARAIDRLGRDHAIDVFIHLIAYADDVSAIIVADSEAEIQLAVDILMEEFVSYFSSAGLAMNPEKSELILFRRGRQSQELKVGNQVESTRVKLLGVTVEKGYQFNSHSSNVSAAVKLKVEKISNAVKLLDY